MRQLVDKPDQGSIIGITQDGKTVAVNELLQNYLDEIQTILNEFILGDAIILPSYTVSTVPTASEYTGGEIYVTDETGGAVPAFSDGMNWRRVTDRAIIS